MEIFKIENGEVVFNMVEVRLIKEFRDLLAKDKGSEGDAQGRKKKQAFKEFGAIYWLYHPFSPGVQKGLSGKELIDDAIDNFGLHKTWQPCPLVVAAAKAYERELNLSNVQVRLYKKIIVSLNNSSRVFDILNKEVNKVLKQDVITKENIADLISMQKQILAMSTDLPKDISKIRDAEELAMRAITNKEVARGGFEVTDSMDVSKAIGNK